MISGGLVRRGVGEGYWKERVGGEGWEERVGGEGGRWTIDYLIYIIGDVGFVDSN